MTLKFLIFVVNLILGASQATATGKIAFEECIGPENSSKHVYEGNSSRRQDVGLNLDKFCCRDYLGHFHFGVYSWNQRCCEGAYKPVYNQEVFQCVSSTDGERVKQKVVLKNKNVKLFIPYYFNRTKLTTFERRNCTIKGQIIITLNEAPDRQAQVATDIVLRLKSNKKRCNKLNKHLYYLVESPEFLTVVIEYYEGPVEPTMIKNMTPLKSKLAKLVKKLFSLA